MWRLTWSITMPNYNFYVKWRDQWSYSGSILSFCGTKMKKYKHVFTEIRRERIMLRREPKERQIPEEENNAKLVLPHKTRDISHMEDCRSIYLLFQTRNWNENNITRLTYKFDLYQNTEQTGFRKEYGIRGCNLVLWKMSI